MSTTADIMHVMAQEVGRPEIFGHRRSAGYERNFWRMASFRNGGKIRRGRRRPDRVRVWRAQD